MSMNIYPPCRPGAMWSFQGSPVEMSYFRELGDLYETLMHKVDLGSQFKLELRRALTELRYDPDTDPYLLTKRHLSPGKTVTINGDDHIICGSPERYAKDLRIPCYHQGMVWVYGVKAMNHPLLGKADWSQPWLDF